MFGWYANSFLIGANIPEGCIVGARSTVTRTNLKPYSIVVGAPAKIISEDVTWKFKRV